MRAVPKAQRLIHSPRRNASEVRTNSAACAPKIGPWPPLGTTDKCESGMAACISNDLYREAAARGITLHRVAVTVRSDYAGTPPVSTPIAYDVAVEGEASEAELIALVGRVDAIAEIVGEENMNRASEMIIAGDGRLRKSDVPSWAAPEAAPRKTALLRGSR